MSFVQYVWMLNSETFRGVSKDPAVAIAKMESTRVGPPPERGRWMAVMGGFFYDGKYEFWPEKGPFLKGHVIFQPSIFKVYEIC